MKINVWFRQGGYLFLARTRGHPRARSRRASRCRTTAACRTRMLSPARGAAHRARARHRRHRGRQLQRRRRRRLPLALRVGLRAGRAEARRRGRHVHDVVGFDTTGTRIDGVRVRRCGPPARRLDVPTTTIRTHRGRQRRRRLVARGRADARRRAAQQAPPPRDLLDRAAQAVAQAARRRPLGRPLLLASRRAARSSAASATSTSPPGLDQDSSPRLPRPVRALARPRVPRPRRSVKVLRQWAGLLRPDARRQPHRRPGRRASSASTRRSGFMGHGFMMAPVVGKLLAAGHRRGRRAVPIVRPLEPAALQGGQAALGGDDHRLGRRTAPR